MSVAAFVVRQFVCARACIVSPPARQRYLVQLTITSLANEAVAQSSDIETIIRGFVVAAK